LARTGGTASGWATRAARRQHGGAGLEAMRGISGLRRERLRRRRPMVAGWAAPVARVGWCGVGGSELEVEDDRNSKE